MENNECVFCKEIIPEGRQVCPNCEMEKSNPDKIRRRIWHPSAIVIIRYETRRMDRKEKEEI